MPVKNTRRRNDRHGQGVDVFGGVAFDPTENVRELFEAAARRQDDLRIAGKELSDAKSAHLKEMADLRAEQARETRAFDSDRYDKIRSVDMVNAASTASQILQAVNTNASMQERTAQTLRDQVASTAAAAENRQAAFAADMMKRLSAVELSLSKGEGKQAVADPQVERLMQAVQLLTATQAQAAGKGLGQSAVWGAIALGVSLLVGLITIGTFLFVTTRGTG